MAERLPDLAREGGNLLTPQQMKQKFYECLAERKKQHTKGENVDVGNLSGEQISDDADKAFTKGLKDNITVRTREDLATNQNLKYKIGAWPFGKKNGYIVCYMDEPIGMVREDDHLQLQKLLNELFTLQVKEENETSQTKRDILTQAKLLRRQVLAGIMNQNQIEEGDQQVKLNEKGAADYKAEAKGVKTAEIKEQKSNDAYETLLHALNKKLHEDAEYMALTAANTQLKKDADDMNALVADYDAIMKMSGTETTDTQRDQTQRDIYERKNRMRKIMAKFLVDYMSLQTNLDKSSDYDGDTKKDYIEKDLCDLLRTHNLYGKGDNGAIRKTVMELRTFVREDKKYLKANPTQKQLLLEKKVVKYSASNDLDTDLVQYMAQHITDGNYDVKTKSNRDGSANYQTGRFAEKGSSGQLTPGAVPGTASYIPLDPVNAVARGETGSQSSKITIKEKSINGSTEEHLVETANLKEKSFADLLLLYSNYQDDPNGTIDSNKRMIQRYMVYNIIAGIAPGSAKDKFQQLGAGDIQQGKARFKEFMLNTIFASDYRNDLITKINMEVYTKTGASRANNSQAFAVGGTSLDKFYGYGTTASSVSNGGQMSRDETIRRVASQLLASEFNTGTGALEVVFNPTTGVYETDSQAADLFREIAVARGLTHPLGTDYNKKDLMKTGLHGALMLGSDTLQEMGVDKGIAEGTVNIIEAATNIAQAGMTVASIFRGTQAGVNVVKGCRNFLFGEGEAYKADFDKAWTRTKSSLGYLAGRETISFIKNPSGYLENSTILQSVMNVAGSDAYKSEQAKKRIVEDGIIILNAKAMSEVTSQIFEGFSPKQLAGVIKAGSQGILVDPEKMVGLPGMTQFEEYLQAVDPIEKKAFLQSQATSLAKSLVDSYGLTPAVLEEIKDSDESLPTLLRSRQLRTQTLQNVLSKIPNIPGIDKNELLKLSDADLKEKLDVLEAVGLLQHRIEKAYFDKRASNSGAAFANKISFDTFNSKILSFKDRPDATTLASPKTFKQYRQEKLNQVAKTPNKAAAETIIAELFNSLSSLAQLHDTPPNTTNNPNPAPAGGIVVPSNVSEPNYWDGKPSLYEYFSEGIPGWQFPPKKSCANHSSLIAENPNGQSPNFIWTNCEGENIAYQ